MQLNNPSQTQEEQKTVGNGYRNNDVITLTDMSGHKIKATKHVDRLFNSLILYYFCIIHSVIGV